MNVSNLVHGNPGGRSCSLLSLVLEHSLLLHFQQTWLYSLISSPILSTLKVKNVFCKIAAVSDELNQAWKSPQLLENLFSNILIYKRQIKRKE